MFANVQQKFVLSRTEELGDFGARTESTSVDSKPRIYYRQYDIDYEVQSRGQVNKKADCLKLNLYFQT